MTDKEIVDLYWSRSDDAIRETQTKYGKYCYSVAFRVLNDPDDTEEVVNDVYLGAWNSLPPHKPAELSTYLAKLTRYLAIKKWQKARAQKRGGGEIALTLEELGDCIPSGQDPESEVEAGELGQAVRSFVAALPSNERNLFVCRYWYFKSIDQICRQYGFSEGKVKSLLQRTRTKLKKYLIKEGFIHEC